MFDYRLRTTAFIYQEYNGKTVYANELPPSYRIVPGSLQIKTPYCDINDTPVYTGDIIAQYAGCTIADIGIVCQDTHSGTFHRTSFKEEGGSIGFSKQDGYYLILGDVTEDPAHIAFVLFKVLSIATFYESEEGKTGILDFLEKFRISKDAPPLTAIQKERALAQIIDYRTRLSWIV